MRVDSLSRVEPAPRVVVVDIHCELCVKKMLQSMFGLKSAIENSWGCPDGFEWESNGFHVDWKLELEELKQNWSILRILVDCVEKYRAIATILERRKFDECSSKHQMIETKQLTRFTLNMTTSSSPAQNQWNPPKGSRTSNRESQHSRPALITC